MPDTSVAFVIFNRPELTAQVFETIRDARPARLFVIADGPRADAPGDVERCAAARAVLDGVDWDCRVSWNTADRNLGVGRRVASGLAWVFRQVREAIVLEDDCLPDPTFFRFCDGLLESCRDDERVMMISGTNPLERWKADAQSFHFSATGSHWGWATWARAWRHYDFGMTTVPDRGLLAALTSRLGDPERAALATRLCTMVRDGLIDSWDVQWTVCQLLRGGLAVVPSVNLVRNAGFGPAATHTRNRLSLGSFLARGSMAFPLTPPPSVEADREYDRLEAAFRLGRPAPGLVIERAERCLTAGRHAHAWLLLEAVRQMASREPLEESIAARLDECRAQALAKLCGPDRRGVR
jgi:hypothetical protein